MAGTTESFDVQRPSGRRLSGILTRCDGVSRGSILLLHGLLSDKNHNFAPALAYMIACKLKLNVYRFDFRNGQDASEPEYRYRFNGFVEDLDDCRVVVAALENAGLGPIRCVFGHSRGANVAIMLTAQWHTVSLLPAPLSIAVSPRFHMSGMLGKFDAEAIARVTQADQPPDAHFVWETKLGPIKVMKADIQEVLSMSMAPYLLSLPAGHPLLLVHGTADTTIPYQDSLDMLAVRGAEQGTEFHSVDGANHTYQRSKHSDFLLSCVCNFLSRHAQDAVLPGLDYSIKAQAAAGTPQATAKASKEKTIASKEGVKTTPKPQEVVTGPGSTGDGSASELIRIRCSSETMLSLLSEDHDAALTLLAYQLALGWL